MKNITKKPKPLESPRFLRFLCICSWGPSSCEIVLVFNSSMDLGQVEGTRDGDIPAHEGFAGRKLTKLQMWFTWIEDYIWVVILGLVLYRDGVREVQDGDGRFHGAWSAKRWTRQNTEELSTNLEFFHHGEWGFPGRAGQVVSTACQDMVCILSFL